MTATEDAIAAQERLLARAVEAAMRSEAARQEALREMLAVVDRIGAAPGDCDR